MKKQTIEMPLVGIKHMSVSHFITNNAELISFHTSHNAENLEMGNFVYKINHFTSREFFHHNPFPYRGLS